jgi:hypothetical protein
MKETVSSFLVKDVWLAKCKIYSHSLSNNSCKKKNQSLFYFVLFFFQINLIEEFFLNIIPDCIALKCLTEISLFLFFFLKKKKKKKKMI